MYEKLFSMDKRQMNDVSYTITLREYDFTCAIDEKTSTPSSGVRIFKNSIQLPNTVHLIFLKRNIECKTFNF